MKQAVVCEHGYAIDLADGAVRHMATHGVCLPNDQAMRDLRDDVLERAWLRLQREQGVGPG